ncbi:MAG: long-chain fatty acid--CoA ligase [candidate division KSB1 bacterium]|nr:long-chain fatty acid--CoA ligase [candidate division KSB1 bacterium]MDZ7358771.1 long-chain fatty acid--CoA ligase [candidate division KSB1 bacterium]MDZ7398598.1 long-chain fatty acid--CoA ligase [candidate division KSB1 bacterium]
MAVTNLTEMFLDTVQRYGTKTALMHKVAGQYQSISYQEFGAIVKDLALGLASLGVKKGDRVALLSENRPQWAFSDFAILSLGAINVPIYPSLLPKQIEYILNDSESKIIITSTKDQTDKVIQILSELPVLKYVVYMDDEISHPKALSFQQVMERGKEFGSQHPEYYDQVTRAIQPDDPAGIIYTSGTTGSPKGAVLTHKNFLSNVQGGTATLHIGPEDTFLSFLPLCHVFERMGGHFCPISVGATIAYAESIDTVAQNLVEVKPTIMTSVPRLFEKMYARVLDNARAGGPIKQKIFDWAIKTGEKYVKAKSKGKVGAVLQAKYNLAHKLVFSKLHERVGGRLRFFVSGGAPLPKEIGEFFHYAGIKILEGYGLTESSPVIALNPEDKFKFGTVGPALVKGGVEIKIADDGEILTRGPHVMKGYYKKPAETKEAIDADGWLHTGDIGYLDEDGYLTITDRKKNIIVTSGGKNIPPAPIENLLLTSPLIDQVLVIGDKRKFLSALIVPNFELVQNYAQEQNIPFKDNQELVTNPQIVQYIGKEVERLCANLARFEQVKAFRLMPKPFTIEEGELTPTLKIKRKLVEEKYAELIDSIYAE